MATIQPTNQVNPATMAANWGKGVSNNAGKWSAAALAPRRLFNADPASAQASYAIGVQAAVANGTYANGLASTDLNAMANSIATTGQAAYAQSGTTKAAKYQRKTASLAAAINNVLSQIQSMPRGKGQNNINRMVQWATLMSQYKGKITAS